MAKLNELIYDVREAINDFSDDSELDNRYIIYLYNTKRAKYLRQELNNYNKTTDNSIQQSLCMELEEVSINECSLDLNCDTILRTKLSLPKPLELHTKTAITKVKPSNKLSIPFNFITKEKAYYLLEGSSFPNSIYSFLDIDNHIYIISESSSHKLLECLNVQGIFENPLELINYKNCCGCDNNNDTVCFNEDETEYPLQPHFIDLIRMEIIKELLGNSTLPEDKTNNSNDEQKNT